MLRRKTYSTPTPTPYLKKMRRSPSRSENFERCSKERRSAHPMLWLMFTMVAQQSQGSRICRRGTFRRRGASLWDFLPYGHFAVNYIKPFIIGKKSDTVQNYGTKLGFPKIINDLRSIPMSAKKNYKLGVSFDSKFLCEFTVFKWLYKFSVIWRNVLRQKVRWRKIW